MTEGNKKYDDKSMSRWMDRGQEKKWAGLSGRFPGQKKPQSSDNETKKDIGSTPAVRASTPEYGLSNLIGENTGKIGISVESSEDEISVEETKKTGNSIHENEIITSTSRIKDGLSGDYEDISYRVLYPSMNSMLEVVLKEGAKFKAESGAMVTMSENINLRGSVDGGLGKAVLRKMFSKEKFFFQLFTAKGGDGKINLSPNLLGDIGVVELDGNKEYSVQKDGFLAGTKGIEVTTKMQNISKGVFSGEGFFIIKVYGKGLLFINTFGAIHPIELKEGEKITVDNKHLVAWANDTKYTINPSAGPLSTFTSGEILVCEFKGPGKVFIQTRNPQGHFEWLNQNLEIKNTGEKKR